jgi:hypothetical protein
MGSRCDGVGGGHKESRRTLAKSFASWPPWLILGYLSRVAAEQAGLTACACGSTPKISSPLRPASAPPCRDWGRSAEWRLGGSRVVAYVVSRISGS